MKRYLAPTPTNLLELTDGHKPAAVLLLIFYNRARSKAGIIHIAGEAVFLERGQCFSGRYELAEYFGLKRSQAGKIQRWIEYLENSVKLIDKRKTRNGSIITILNFDEMTKFRRTDKQSIGDQ